jgi:DNA (cytosine-5)-methyltransferase 1
LNGEVKQIGNIVDTGNWDNPQRGRIYSADGICPALNTVGGGGLEPKIIEDFYVSREPRVYDETAPTIRAEREGLKVIVASRGRNPGNPSDRKQGIELEQRLEPNSEGICNTLTSVQKDNLLLTPNNWKHKAGDGTKTRSRRISEIHPALQANTGASQQTYLAETPYRIRKLTPKECAKLMKFSDEDANKMLEVNSNTQVYKQCGNSIVVSVLEAIFCQMNIKGCPTWEERAKEEYL